MLTLLRPIRLRVASLAALRRSSSRSPLLLFLPPFTSGLLGSRALRGFRLSGAAGGGAFCGVSRRELPGLLGVMGQEFAWTVAVDDQVLDQGHSVGGDPVDEQSGGEAGDERRERYREQAHHPSLPRVVVLGRHLTGHEEQRGREHRQDEVRIRPGEVGEPEEAPAREAREGLLVAAYDAVEREEDLYLHQDGQEAGQWVDPALLVELRHGLLLLPAVLLIP